MKRTLIALCLLVISFSYASADGFQCLNRRVVASYVVNTAFRYGIDPALALAVAEVESGCNPKARSKKGAYGVMQLIPSTARRLGVNPYSFMSNVIGGVRYLKMLLKRFNYNLDLALASYNAGPLTVEKYGGVPPFKETQHFVALVKRYYRKYSEMIIDYAIRKASMKYGVLLRTLHDIASNSNYCMFSVVLGNRHYCLYTIEQVKSFTRYAGVRFGPFSLNPRWCVLSRCTVSDLVHPSYSAQLAAWIVKHYGPVNSISDWYALNGSRRFYVWYQDNY